MDNSAPQHYTDPGFWKKLKKFALKAGREVVEKALVLYYCMKDPDTPPQAKAIIAGALGYFILPIDAIPDFVPGAGFIDDLGAMAAAAVTISAHIKDEHRSEAVSTSRRWFGEEGSLESE